jgi:hypothetical protein
MDLMSLWYSYNMRWGLMKLADHLPKILDDLAEDAASHDGPCPVCDGRAYVMLDGVRHTCVECAGFGRVRVPGDAHARQLVFKLVALT